MAVQTSPEPIISPQQIKKLQKISLLQTPKALRLNQGQLALNKNKS